MSNNYIELKENFSSNENKFAVMSKEVLKKIEDVQKLLETLKDYSSRIGTPRDSKTFRKSLKEKLMTTTIELKEVTEALNQMENIEVSERSRDDKKKQIRRLREACSKELKEATELMKNIEKMEKIYVQNARISIQNKEEGGGESFDHENQSRSLSKQWMEMDVDEELLRERENDIIELTKLLTEMNAMAKLQAKLIQEQGEELVFIYDNVEQTAENTQQARKELEEAKKYKDQTVRSDTKLFIFIGIGCLVIILLFLLSSSPEEELEADAAAVS